MKKLYFLPALLAAGAFTLASCSSDDDLNGGTANAQGSQYMSVEIINATQGLQGNAAKKSPLTRADNNQGNNGLYSDGTADESTLSNARFIFFDANGNLVNMNDGNPYAQINDLSSSLIKNEDDTNSKDDTQTIERKYGLVVLDPVRGSVPNQVMAIANYDAIPESERSFSSTDNININNIVNNGNTSWTVSSLYKQDGNKKYDFIMSSTVFANSQNQIQAPAPTAGKIRSDRNAALNNPVQIYVERVAAKVEAQHGTDNRWIKVTENADDHSYNVADANASNALDAYEVYKSDDKDAPEFVTNTGEAYKYNVIAVVKGIGLADEMNKAYLYKNIAGGRTYKWDDNADGQGNLGFAFSIPNFHRSFWETVPDQTNNLKNHSWTDYTDGQIFPKNLNTSNTEGNVQAMYTFPNTPTNDMWQAALKDEDGVEDYWNYNSSQTRLTKLLLATQLYVDTNNDGKYEPTTIYQFGGQNYLDETSVKNAIASTLPIVIGTKQEDGTTKWEDISAANIDIVPPANNSNDQSQYMETLRLVGIGNGQVVAQGSIANGTVTFEGAEDKWSKSQTDGGVANAQAFINDNATYKPIIYKDGMSYYYTTIRHLATDKSKLGYFGVVRNHEYRINVTGLGGFGTAVYEPNNTIIPVTPTNKNTYMAAQINVLQWRVVEQNVKIDTQNPDKNNTTPTGGNTGGETGE